MTFCVTVAVAAAPFARPVDRRHRPSLSLRCQVRRRSIAPVMPWAPAARRRCVPARPSRPRTSGGCRRATAATRRGTRCRQPCGRSPSRSTYHDAHVRFRGLLVDFTFNADQEELRRAVRSFMERESPSSYVRAMIDDDRGFTDAVWTKVVDLGGRRCSCPRRTAASGSVSSISSS